VGACGPGLDAVMSGVLSIPRSASRRAEDLHSRSTRTGLDRPCMRGYRAGTLACLVNAGICH
jgi:hypothetical protein